MNSLLDWRSYPSEMFEGIEDCGALHLIFQTVVATRSHGFVNQYCKSHGFLPDFQIFESINFVFPDLPPCCLCSLLRSPISLPTSQRELLNPLVLSMFRSQSGEDWAAQFFRKYCLQRFTVSNRNIS